MAKRAPKQDNDLPFPDGDGSEAAAEANEVSPPLNRGGKPILPPVADDRLSSILGRTKGGSRAASGPELIVDREFFLPVHGFVELTAEEAHIVDHPAFQRLGSIYQLGQTHLVYRGATHTRLEHVLGTLYVAEEMVATINKNHSRLQRQIQVQEESPLDQPISEVERIFIRLAALLHDIGHLPAGHTLEDELHLLDKHDGLGRLTTVLDREDWPGLRVETLRTRIDTLYAPWVANLGVSPSELVIRIVAKPPRDGEPPLPGVTPPIDLFRLEVCRDIVGNTICADLLDYLHRDWYHIGKQRYFERRLLQYMEVRRNTAGIPQIVVSLGTRPKIRTDAVSAILNLLESRYELAESVLFHRTKCSAAAMLERGLQELTLDHTDGKERENWATGLEKILLDQNDKGVVDHFANAAASRKVEASILPLDCLRQRRLYRGVLTMLRDEVPGDVAKRLLRTFAEGPDAARNRHHAMVELERDFELKPGSLAMYCPDKGMNAKIAEVKIHVNGSIETFSQWERDNDNLGGGHLKAQIRRFENLWRIHIFLERNEWARLSQASLALLRMAVHTLVLGFSVTGNTLDESAEILATLLGQQSEIGYATGQAPKTLIAARSRSGPSTYPSGAPTLRSFFG